MLMAFGEGDRVGNKLSGIGCVFYCQDDQNDIDDENYVDQWSMRA